METGLNLNSLVADSNGRFSFSGLTSGIDFKKAVDQIIAAKRRSAVTLETRVGNNEKKIAAYRELRTKLSALRDVLARLRGSITADGTGNAFKAKKTFTSTLRTDGATPSAAGNLLGVTVSQAAAPGVHELEIRRVAKAHKIASKAFSSLSAALGVAGTVTVGGKTVTLAATDSLADVRERVNAVNAGSSPSGITASIVSVSATEHVLVLTKDATGSTMAVTDTGSVLGDLGLSTDHGVTFSTTLQAAQTARLTADGLVDPDRFESDVQASATAKLNTLFTPTNASGTFSINGTVVTYDAATDSLQDLANRISATVPDVTATVAADGEGFRMDLTTTLAAITVSDPSGLMGQLGLDNAQVIERTSNTVSDLFAGVTLSLFQPEPNTKIKVEVEQDLSAAKADITAFVGAYNEVRRLINDHSEADPVTGTKGSESGELFGESTLSDIRARLARVVGGNVAGVGADFAVLAQIGIKLVDNNAVDDPLDKNTLVVDEARLDNALLNNAADVRRLFAFDFSSSSSAVSLLDYSARTGFSPSGYVLNVGTIGLRNRNSVEVADKDALLGSGDSIAATVSGQFTLNGTPIAYDVAIDSLQTVVNKINGAGIEGVSAGIKAGAGGSFIAISSANSPVTLAGDTGDFLANADFQPDTNIIDSANIGGASDGSSNGTVSINGRVITVGDQSGAEGLKLFYAGAASTAGIQLNFTEGLASDLFFDVDTFVDLTDGAIQARIAALEGENVVAEDRIEGIDRRLEIERDSLTKRFIAMETALQTLSRVREQISQFLELSTQRR